MIYFLQELRDENRNRRRGLQGVRDPDIDYSHELYEKNEKSYFDKRSEKKSHDNVNRIKLNEAEAFVLQAGLKDLAEAMFCSSEDVDI